MAARSRLRRGGGATCLLFVGFGLVTALLIGAGVPAGYFVTHYSTMHDIIADEGKEISASLERHIHTNSNLWRFEDVRLSEIIAQVHGEEDVWSARLLDETGEEIVAVGPVPDAPMESDLFPIVIQGRQLATVKLIYSVRDLYAETALLAAVSLGLGLGILYITWIGARAMRVRDVEETERRETLERLIAERTAELATRTESLLEEAKRREATELGLRAAKEDADHARLRLTEAIESTTEGFVLYDSDQRLVICNAKFRALNAEIADMIEPGVTLKDILEWVAHSDMIDLGSSDPAAWVEERLANTIGTGDLRYRNGLWLRRSSRRTHDGGIVFVFTDITNLKEGEAALVAARDDAESARARLIEAIETIDEGFVLYDKDGRLVICNSKFVAINPGVGDIIRPGVLRTDILGGLARGGHIDMGNTDPDLWVQQRLAHVDGVADLHYTNGNWQRSIFRRTQDGGLVVVFMDITNLKDGEAALRRAKDEAEAANRSKSQFLANMSHEIRTPMNGVIGMAELLSQSALNDRQRKFVRTIHESGMTLLAIINDILDLSRIEAGRLALDRAEFSIREAGEEVAALMASAAARKNIDLTLTVANDVPAMVWGDQARFRQVLINLVGNAVKFTERGTVRVEIAAPKTDAQIVPVTIAVHDTGIGIDSEARARLFKSFEQADGSITRRFGGTGLGLSISQQLVSLMGGRIEVDSVPGKGSTFRLTIPFDRGGIAVTEQAHRTTGAWPRRVLIVSEDAAVRSGLVSSFENWQVETNIVGDATAALERLARAGANGRPFELVVFDAATPADSGVAFATALRASPVADTTRVILMEAVDRPSAAVSILDERKVGVVTKPVRQSDVYDMIASLFERQATGPRNPGRTTSAPSRSMLFTSSMVLLVEDNPVNQEVNTELLKGLGCEVELATTGWEAIAAFERAHFDLILMDCQMPELDGLEATKRIRRIEAGKGTRTLIVALTAHAFEEDRQRCFAAGMDDYLSKPMTTDQLTAVFKRWIQPARPIAPQTAMTVPSKSGASSSAPSSAESPNPLMALRDQAGATVVVSVVNTYLSSTPKQLAALREALDRSDAVVIERTAHSLRSSSAIVGGDALSAVCHELERIGKDGRLDSAHALLTQAEQAFTVLQASLRTEFLESSEVVR